MRDPRPRNPLLVVAWSLGLLVLVHTTQYVAIGLTMATTGATFGAVASGAVRAPEAVLIKGVVGLLLGIPAAFGAVRFLWRRSAAWMGLGMRPRLLGIGAALGAALATQTVWVLAALDVAHVRVSELVGDPAGLTAALIGALTWSLFVATVEEVVFRGMITRELAARRGWPLAAAAGGLVFAGMHPLALLPVLRPADAAWSAVAAAVASALFTALYVRTGSLWLPIGCHWGWNLVLSGVFGATMSGHASPPAVLSTVLDGPLAVSGGGFGLEASIVAMVLMALAAALAAVLPRGAGLASEARARQRCPDPVG
ncbi:MAG: lysostaphin resistance A-like protein [Thermoanaerobaculaceae bacterium]